MPSKTRFPELQYEHRADHWRILDVSDGSESGVGPLYASKAELLADLERYATDFGCDGAAEAKARPPEGITGQDTQPTEVTNRDWEQVFRVWTPRREGKDWGPLWECVATFGYLPDCLDYIAALQDAGLKCVYQSPADCRLIEPTDTRAVAKGEPATV